MTIITEVYLHKYRMNYGNPLFKLVTDVAADISLNVQKLNTIRQLISNEAVQLTLKQTCLN